MMPRNESITLGLAHGGFQLHAGRGLGASQGDVCSLQNILRVSKQPNEIPAMF